MLIPHMQCDHDTETGEGGMSDAGDGKELDEAGDIGGSTEDFEIFNLSPFPMKSGRRYELDDVSTASLTTNNVAIACSLKRASSESKRLSTAQHGTHGNVHGWGARHARLYLGCTAVHGLPPQCRASCTAHGDFCTAQARKFFKVSTSFFLP